MTQSLVTVVVVNWNGGEMLERCLTSIAATPGQSLEIIVVDNASVDNSCECVRLFPGTHLIRNTQNTGFAAANNAAFAVAKGEYVALVNNDVFVAPGWLEEPLSVFRDDDRTGIVASRLMQESSPATIDILYHYLANHLVFEPEGINTALADTPSHLEPGYVIGAGGGLCVFRKSLLDALGGFEERFFAYHEDADLCMRAFLRGWRCRYAPTSYGLHKGSASFSRNIGGLLYYHTRNRMWFIYRNFPAKMVASRLHCLLWFEVKRACALALRREVAKSYTRALRDALAGLKQYREERRENLKLYINRACDVDRLMKRRKNPICY